MITLLVNFAAAVIMAAGTVLTLFPRFHGNLFILAGAFIAINGNGKIIPPYLLLELTILAAAAEIGSVCLRWFLTKDYDLAPSICINSVVGHIAGLVITGAILGLVSGTILWEIFVGKTLLPRFDVMTKVMVRLAMVAAFRWVCGWLMVLIIFRYLATVQ
ncbi:Hypothetical protein LUCI_1258 [Lucifera butyrica]|uniref:Uncharacterized protein n=1 Tax=Lucifera butyrica TaxID=1351585 RepID=A0A498R5E2_9FIRM|nr:hypothetical protein [Lucifera butyrica]VBB06047.1 Hypothetical protein LUCI_1258 [Lucifera butyrica]